MQHVLCMLHYKLLKFCLMQVLIFKFFLEHTGIPKCIFFWKDLEQLFYTCNISVYATYLRVLRMPFPINPMTFVLTGGSFVYDIFLIPTWPNDVVTTSVLGIKRRRYDVRCNHLRPSCDLIATKRDVVINIPTSWLCHLVWWV